jgi:hypothetical protein
MLFLTKYNELEPIKLHYRSVDDEITYEFLSFDDNPNKQILNLTPTQYAVAYKNIRTEVLTLFIANNEEILDDNYELFQQYAEFDEESSTIKEILSQLKEHGITVKTDNFDNNIFVVDYELCGF